MTYQHPVNLFVALAGLSWACVGTIEDAAPDPGAGSRDLPGPGSQTPGDNGAGNGSGMIGGGAGTVDPPKPLDDKRLPGKVCGTYPNARPAIGPTPMRRLTRAEYDNTVQDLLGDDSHPSVGFPEDMKARSFDNNAGLQVVTAALAGDYFDAAQALAAKAVGKPAIVPACAGGPPGEEGCAGTFIKEFGKRAFRRPLTADDAAEFTALYKAARVAGGDHKAGMRQVLASMLQSPFFIYRLEFGEQPGGKGLASWEMASRLSYFLWNSMPDPDLFAAAEANALKTPEQIKLQAGRMFKDPKAHRMVARFHELWLGLDRLAAWIKDDKALKTPMPFATVSPMMKEETARFVEDAFWQADGSAQKLFTSSTSFINKDLAAFLGLPKAATMTAAFKPVTLDGTQRAGILTQASFLSLYAKPAETSPILRGKGVLEQFLCVNLPPPPPNVKNTPPPRVAGQTTRERFLLHEKTDCAVCHRIMDPVGFAFESYDAVGRWKTMDAGKPVDTSGTVRAVDLGTGADATFMGGVELSKLVGESSEMKKCVAKQWLRFALGREEVEQDEKSLEQLFCSFEGEAKTFNMRDLVLGITQTEAFAGRQGGAQ